MKKALSNSKLSNPSKLVRKVLFRSSSNTANQTNDKTNTGPSTSTPTKTSKSERDTASLKVELTNLKEQLAVFQLAIDSMQEDAEEKEKALANLQKEKQELYIHLKKEKRSSINLKQQLQEERDFYFKEKEQYCQEMNDCKKLKKKLSESIINKQEEKSNAELVEHKNRIVTLQEALNQTLESNYNLSVKFMRMKNTKTNLKNRLKQHDTEHKKAMNNLVMIVNNMKKDLDDVVDKRFNLPISSSNKKYLQVIKQNGTLMYENLCLQMEVDRLTAQIDHIKFSQSKAELRKKFKFVSKDVLTQTETQSKVEHPEAIKKCQTEKVHQRAKSKHTSVSTKNEKIDETVVKVFERNATSSIPQIIMLPDDHPNVEIMEGDHPKAIKKCQTQKVHQRVKSKHISVSTKNEKIDGTVVEVFKKKETFGIPQIIMLPEDTPDIQTNHPNVEIMEPPNTNNKAVSSCLSKLSMIAQCASSHSTFRAQSAPEIMQTSLFVNKFKP